MVNNPEIRVISNELLLWNFFELSENKDFIFCGYTTKFTYHLTSENKTLTEKAIFTALLNALTFDKYTTSSYSLLASIKSGFDT